MIVKQNQSNNSIEHIAISKSNEDDNKLNIPLHDNVNLVKHNKKRLKRVVLNSNHDRSTS